MQPDNRNGTEIAIAIENLHFAWRTGMDPVLRIERLQVLDLDGQCRAVVVLRFHRWTLMHT